MERWMERRREESRAEREERHRHCTWHALVVRWHKRRVCIEEVSQEGRAKHGISHYFVLLSSYKSEKPYAYPHVMCDCPVEGLLPLADGCWPPNYP